MNFKIKVNTMKPVLLAVLLVGTGLSANLANAQLSTGPVSVAGKAASSANSLKHGLTAQTVLLPGEDEAAYRKMCEGMFEKFAPACTPEQELVQLLCDIQWRLSAAGVSKPPSSPPMRRTSKLSTS